MHKVRVLWTPQHAPTEGQIADLLEGATIVFLKDIEPDLFGHLSNCPCNSKELQGLSFSLLDTCCNKQVSVIILPIGSPAFMFTLASLYREAYINGYYSDCKLPEVWFSHSERVSFETLSPDGSIVKTSKFIHRGYVKVTS